jgi:hypothetical protein
LKTIGNESSNINFVIGFDKEKSGCYIIIGTKKKSIAIVGFSLFIGNVSTNRDALYASSCLEKVIKSVQAGGQA